MGENRRNDHSPVLAGDLSAPLGADEVRYLVGKAPPPVKDFVSAD